MSALVEIAHRNHREYEVERTSPFRTRCILLHRATTEVGAAVNAVQPNHFLETAFCLRRRTEPLVEDAHEGFFDVFLLLMLFFRIEVLREEDFKTHLQVTTCRFVELVALVQRDGEVFHVPRYSDRTAAIIWLPTVFEHVHRAATVLLVGDPRLLRNSFLGKLQVEHTTMHVQCPLDEAAGEVRDDLENLSQDIVGDNNLLGLHCHVTILSRFNIPR